MAKLKSQNPYTQDVLETFEPTTDSALEDALARAADAFTVCRKESINLRARRLEKLAEILERDRESLAQTAVAEMGKTITAARAEVEKCALTARWFAARLPDLLADHGIQVTPYRQFVRHLPLGPVLAVMPWNFPYWQVFRAAIPALGAGNVMLLKHASNVSRCALRIEKSLREAGFSEGRFQTLLLESSRIARLIADRRIQAVTLTGSEAAGRSVAAEAGKNLKKCVLELGGSDPFLVLPSADLHATVAQAATARTLNNGQSCIAAKRFIIHTEIFDAFTTAFAEKLKSLKVGDPMMDETDLGPLVHAEAAAGLWDQYERALHAGADVALKPTLEKPRNLFSPGLLIAPENSRDEIFSEEMFGPLAIVYRARDLEHGLELANSSVYGLGSSVWSQDLQEIESAINGIESGITFVNRIVASEPQLPFGGIKASGYGRELGLAGIREFMNAKSVSFGADKLGESFLGDKKIKT